MEVLVGMVRQLLVLSVLAVFLELLLPGGALRRYVQVVVGLMVVITILSAAGDLLRRDWSSLLPAVATGQRTPYEAGNADKSLEQYREGLVRQILGLARLHGGLPVTDVQVELEQVEGAHWGQVKLIRLVLEPVAHSAAGGGSAPVQEVIVSRPLEEIPVTIEDFARVIASFYDVQPDRVEITVR